MAHRTSKHWFSKSWLSCQEYSERLSRQMDEPLSLWEKLGYKFHHYWCFTCRRFHKQLKQIEEGLKGFAKHCCSEEFEEEGPKLSDDEKARIQQALNKEISGPGPGNGIG